MSTWLPEAGFGALSVQENLMADDFVKTYEPAFNVVVTETLALRPKSFPIPRYAVVEAAESGTKQQRRWRRQEDDTIVLPAPASLSVAITALAAAASGDEEP
jgi:hypothetical protein